jgi:prepilin-type processing-associated H-X9-DG protein
MSNELNTPMLLICPIDSQRQKHLATAWSITPFTPRSTIPFTSNTNTSYFVGVDAADTNPMMFLAGDRNLAVKNVALPPGLHSLSTNTPVSWTREIHGNQGNVLMADASVQQFSTASLQKALENTGGATNRLAVP